MDIDEKFSMYNGIFSNDNHMFYFKNYSLLFFVSSLLNMLQI